MRTKWTINHSLAILLSLSFSILCFSGKAVSESNKTTNWLSSGDFKNIFESMRNNRYYPTQIEGRQRTEHTIEYRGVFSPYPDDLDRFEVRWGMSEAWHKKYNSQFTSEGYSEVFHNSFKAKNGHSIHQALWIKHLFKLNESGVNIIEWTSSSELQKNFNRFTDNRFYPKKIEGRLHNGNIQYRAEFYPYPYNLDHFRANWAQSDLTYKKRREEYLAKGYREIFHHTFKDLNNKQTHQAIWLQLHSSEAQATPDITKLLELEEHLWNKHLKLVKLLEEHKFKSLITLIDQLVSSSMSSPSNETELSLALSAFKLPNENLEKHLKEFTNTHKNNYVPRLISGVYNTAMGWHERGYKWRKDTTDNQINNMKQRFEKAVSDLIHVIKAKPKLSQAYAYLIEINMALGSDELAKTIMQQGLGHTPLSLEIRNAYMRSLLPKWGGSIRHLNAYIQTTRPYYKDNPKLKVLEGEIPHEMGEQARYANHYGKALVYYDEALSHGESEQFYHSKGRILVKLRRYQEAIDAFSKSLALSPFNRWSIEQRAYLRRITGDIQGSTNDYTKLIALLPNDREFKEELAFTKRLAKNGD